MLRSLLRKNNAAFTLLYLFYSASYSAFYMFMVNYFKQVLGFDDFAASFSPTCTMLALLISPPILGYLADTYFPLKRMCMVMISLALPTTLLMMRVRGLWAFPVIFVLSILDAASSSLFDSWILRLRATVDPEVEYGLIKGVSALGGGFLAMYIGQKMTTYGYTLMFYGHFALLALTLFFLFFVDPVDCPNKHRDRAQVETAPGPVKKSYAQAIGLLIRNRPYVVIVLSVLFTQFAHRAAMGFLARIILELGGNSGHTGTANLLRSSFNFIFMLLTTSLINRGKSKEVLLSCGLCVGLFAYVFLCFHYTLTVFVGLQALVGVCTGFWGRIFASYMADVCPKELTSTGITIGVAVATGVGGVMGSIFGGWMMENLGVYPYIVATAAVSAVAVAVSLINVRDARVRAAAGQQT